MKIKSPLALILKPDIVEFEINIVNGVYVLTAEDFKQNLKVSEYEKIMANIDNDPNDDGLPFPKTEENKA